MKRTITILTLALLVLSTALVSGRPFFQASTLPAQLTDPEFWRMVSEFSEAGGNYPYQNFVGNEITLQRVIPPAKRATRPNGVYIGVGSEQNFTYASALQSKMAFVVDIRRQNMLLHLMYKALFEMSPNRADFVSHLFSRKRPSGLDEKTSVAALFGAYQALQGDADFHLQNLQAIRSSLSMHGFKLTADDLSKIDHVYEAFYLGGPTIAYDFMSPAPASSIPYPSYLSLMTATDAAGQNWSYLASEENFRHVREMERKNMIVPLVGDFAGPVAIRAVGRFLKDNKTNVTAFYISNVEAYLDPQQLKAFYSNIAALPSDSSSLLLRFVNTGVNAPFTWQRPGAAHQSVVSRMSVLVDQVNAGTPPSYPALLAPIQNPATLDVP